MLFVYYYSTCVVFLLIKHKITSLATVSKTLTFFVVFLNPKHILECWSIYFSKKPVSSCLKKQRLLCISRLNASTTKSINTKWLLFLQTNNKMPQKYCNQNLFQSGNTPYKIISVKFQQLQEKYLIDGC